MYSKNEIEEIVRSAVMETFDLNEINSNLVLFKEDLNASSLDMVSLALVLEDEFSEEIEDDKMEFLKSIDDVIKYIINRQNNRILVKNE